MKRGREPDPQVGTRFGKLVVLGESFVEGRDRRLPCRCDCGAEVKAFFGPVLQGKVVSCGCYRRARTAEINPRSEYPEALRSRWSLMKDRCTNAATPGYADYGGRGITVCPEWMASSAAFCEWALSHGWDPALTLGRIDNDGPYSPANCRFEMWGEQARNKRNTRWVEIDGVSKSAVEWAEHPEAKVSYKVFWARLKAGWAPWEALTTPPGVRLVSTDNRDPLYRVWRGWLDREKNPNVTGYGIVVCPQWRESFPAFRDFVLQAGWEPGRQCRQPDPARPFGPDNFALMSKGEVHARWMLEAFGERKSAYAWSKDERCVVSFTVLLKRLEEGWDPERALSEPEFQGGKGRAGKEVTYEIDGVVKTKSEWCREYGVLPDTVKARMKPRMGKQGLRPGVSFEEALRMGRYQR